MAHAPPFQLIHAAQSAISSTIIIKPQAIEDNARQSALPPHHLRMPLRGHRFAGKNRLPDAQHNDN
ncbi:hypothetical protein [Paenibacillus vortex]|uniref:hypothetical protein n=1 Tax=Paenibacillus vortex TaxID=71995 RepID=UPI00110FB2F0|nr:hypothetical protein [Paenibacillus vortex]